jgi:hypothetical protein
MRKYTALFFLIMFMIGTDTFLISPLLQTLQTQFGISKLSRGRPLVHSVLDDWNRFVAARLSRKAVDVTVLPLEE